MGRSSLRLLNIIPCFFQLGLFALSAFADIPKYYGVVGGKASLPCNISVSINDETIALIMWYKGENGVPIYTLDSRKHSLQEARHFPSSEFSERAYFDVILKTPNLTISPVNKADEGEYKCRIDYRRSRTVTYNVQLEIIVPPQEVIIRDVNGTKVHGVIGPYDEGLSFTLICEAIGGSPLPSLTWWQASSLLDDSFSFDEGNRIVKNELFLPKLDRTDLMATLSCQATNTNLTAPAVSTVTVDMNVKPVEVYFSDVHWLTTGKKGSVVCETTGSRPPAVLTFWKDGQQLQVLEENISQDDHKTKTKVTFIPSAEDNGKYVTCRANNPRLSNSSLESKMKLDVHHSPILRLTLGSNIQHSSIKEGTDVYFDCNIKSNPWVVNIGWLFQGTPLHTNESNGVVINESSLLLQKVTKEHRGQYQCVAANSEGKGQSEIVRLEVQYSPTCKNQQETTIQIKRKEAVNITCVLDADPDDCTFLWTLNHTEKDLNMETIFLNGTMNTITYTARTLVEFGELQCWGRNSVGMQKYPCIFKITEVENMVAGSVNPILGVLIGIFGVLLILCGVVVFVMHWNNGDADKVQPRKEIEIKTEEALKKEIEELQDMNGKDPDIIPPSSDIQNINYDKKKDIYRSRLTTSSHSTYSSDEVSEIITSTLPQRIKKPTAKDPYVEQTFPTITRHLLRQTDSSKEYTEIDLFPSSLLQKTQIGTDYDEDDFDIATEWPLVYNIQLNKRLEEDKSNGFHTKSTFLQVI